MAGPWEDYSGGSAESESGPWSDYGQADIVKQAVTPERSNAPLEQRLAEARQRLSARNPETFGPQAENNALERKTYFGEVGAGLQDIVNPIPEALSGNSPRQAFLAPAKVALGIGRTLGALLGSSYIHNAAAGLGETVADTAGKILPGPIADAAGAVTYAGTDTLANLLTGRGVGAAKPLVKAKAPLRAEKIAALQGQADDVIASTTRNADAAATSAASITEAELKNAAQVAANSKASVPTRAGISRQYAENAPLGVDVGSDFGTTFKAKASASSEKFRGLYKDVEEAGASIPAPAESYGTNIKKLVGEGGISRPLPTRAEGVANKAKSLVDVDDAASSQVAALEEAIKKANPAEKGMAQAALKEFLGASDMPAQPTFRDLMLEHQRLSGGERAAYRAGDKNLGRQFGELKDGLMADMQAADSTLAGKYSGLGKQYSQEHVPYFSYGAHPERAAQLDPQAVVESLIRPASDKASIEKVSRSFDLLSPAQREGVSKVFVEKGLESAGKRNDFNSGVVSWWNKYADEAGTGNKVLKTVLGDRYDSFKGVVETLRDVKPKSLDDSLAAAVKEINKRGQATQAAIQGRRADTLESALDNGAQIAKDRAAGNAGTRTVEQQVAALRKQTADKIAALSPDVISEKALNTYGLGTAVYGAVGVVQGLPMAGAALATGIGVMMAKGTAVKLLNNVKGAELMFRAMRAAPGTTQAAALARQINTLVKGLEKDEKKPAPEATDKRPRRQAERPIGIVRG